MNRQDFLYELQLHSAAAFFDLTSKDGRLVSVKAVEKFFFQLCKVFLPELFIEAGAKDASISRRARRYLPEARIVAFEANPHNFTVYAPQIDKKDRLEYLNLALDEKSGTVQFQLQIEADEKRVAAEAGHHSLLKRVDVPSKYEEVSVPAVSLDEFFVNDLASCALWIDVEGAASRVLEGAKQVLGAATHMLIEVEDRALWTGQWLRPQVLTFLGDAGFTPVVRDFQSRYQYNVLLVRTTLLERDRFRHSLATYFSTIGSGLRTSG